MSTETGIFIAVMFVCLLICLKGLYDYMNQPPDPRVAGEDLLMALDPDTRGQDGADPEGPGQGRSPIKRDHGQSRSRSQDKRQ